MIYTDDPARDFSYYDSEQVKEQAEYDCRCIKCARCGEAIRPYEDKTCYILYDDEYLHPDCLRDMFKTMTKKLNNKVLGDLFDLMEDAYEDAYQTRTPEPVEA